MIEQNDSKPAEVTKVPHRWRNLFTLTSVMVVDNTEGSATSSIFPAIAKSLNLGSSHLGILTAVGKVLSAPLGPFWVWVSTKLGRRNTLILTSVIGGLFGVAAGFSNNWPTLLVCTALMSASVIGAQPIVNAVIADSFDDKERGNATGFLYGAINTLAAFIGPLLAQFTGFTNGWRYAMWSLGGVCALAGLIVAIFFVDPGVGASDAVSLDREAAKKVVKKPTVKEVVSLFRTPTYSIMMVSRLLSGHLLITVFGIQFLVVERGFTNAVASLVMIPFGIGYLAGSLAGGASVKWLDVHFTTHGRVTFVQSIQVLFAIAAFFGTQFNYGDAIWTYGAFWAVMGFAQGCNPPVNRPIVASVVLPELRGQAFAIWLTIFETIGWAVFSIACGNLASIFGIQRIFFWIMVVLLLVNALWLGLLHKTYPHDVAVVQDVLRNRINGK